VKSVVSSFAWIGLLFALILTTSILAQSPSGKTTPQAHLRYLCAAEGNVPPKVFGEWPLFQPARRLVLEGGPSGSQVLAPNLLPLSAGGYQGVAVSPGRVLIQEVPAEPNSKTPPEMLAALNFLPKADHFYTLVIRQGQSGVRLELLEDEPAVLPPSKEGEKSPPPRRSLRCLVLESGARMKISCLEAGVKLEANSDKPAVAENLKKGIWSLAVEGENKGTPVSTTVELDLESPGNWTLFFMRDIYGRLAPTLKKDATLE
jgi:hypothetical protein